ncbi:hypothetical protein HDR59_02910 [bacterium]|nr:hypothetical protein [bacterium]
MKIYNIDGKTYNSIAKLSDTLNEISLFTLITELKKNKDTDVYDLIKNEYLRRMNVYTR